MVKESSFFEKLKKGMGVEIPSEKTEEKVKIEEVKKIEMETTPVEEKREEIVQTKKVKREKKEVKESFPQKTPETEEKWFEPEGQLAIDVYQTEDELVIQSAIAGVKPENLDISIEKDVISIRGKREKPFEEKKDYFSQECYWGAFSREIILPVEVDPNRVKASMKEGILTIRIPKILREKKRKIVVRE